MTLTLKQKLAAATLSVAAATGAQAACTGGNSAGCGTAAAQSGSAVAQANAEGGQAGNIKVPAITLGIGSAATSANLAPGGCGVRGWELNIGIAKKWGVEGDKDCIADVAAAQARRQACLDGLKLAETGVANGSPRAQQLGNMGMTMAIQNCDGAAGAAQQTIDLGILCEEESKKDGKHRKLDMFNRCVIDTSWADGEAARRYAIELAKAGKPEIHTVAAPTPVPAAQPAATQAASAPAFSAATGSPCGVRVTAWGPKVTKAQVQAAQKKLEASLGCNR